MLDYWCCCQPLETIDAGTGVILESRVYGSGIDKLLSADLATASQRFFFHENAVGSIVDMTDRFAEVREEYRYDDIYGHLRFYECTELLNGTRFRFETTGSINGNRFLFTGRERDPETGLHYHRARYLDPKAGRFMCPDPVGASLDTMLNTYRYASNRPTTLTDPTGLLKEMGGDVNSFGEAWDRSIMQAQHDVRVKGGLNQWAERDLAAGRLIFFIESIYATKERVAFSDTVFKDVAVSPGPETDCYGTWTLVIPPTVRWRFEVSISIVRFNPPWTARSRPADQPALPERVMESRALFVAVPPVDRAMRWWHQDYTYYGTPFEDGERALLWMGLCQCPPRLVRAK